MDDKRSNIAYIIAVTALLCSCAEPYRQYNSDFFAGELAIIFIIPLRGSQRKTVPRGKPNGKFSRPDAIKVERGADEI